MNKLGMCLICSLLAGCSQFPKPNDPNFAPVYPAYKEAEAPIDGSLFHVKSSLALYQDTKAHKIGDIITVNLSEKTDASKSGATKLKKDSDATIANPTVLGTRPEFSLSKALPLPLESKENLNLSAAISADRGFDGSSESKQKNTLSGTITVTVTQILSNGNLYVRGEKWITINTGDEFIRLAGVIRPEDINPDNTIDSYRMADARISYSGRGSNSDATAPGFLTRFFNHWLFPI